MINILPKSIQKLIDAFEQLPGIGPKTAQRLTFYLLRADQAKTKELAEAAQGLHENLKFCSICSNFTQTEECLICSDPQRDKTRICIVSEPFDLIAVEKSQQYNGFYHVLHGVLSPLDGIGPEHLTIDKLLLRIKSNQEILQEIIFATNPTLEGEATAMYIARLLKPFSIRLLKNSKESKLPEVPL